MVCSVSSELKYGPRRRGAEWLIRRAELATLFIKIDDMSPAVTREERAGLAATGWEVRGKSKLQTQLAVSHRASKLNEAISRAVPRLATARFAWCAPLQGDPKGAFYEPRGEEVLDYLGLESLKDDYRKFWPKPRRPEGVPNWDALARLEFPGGRSIVLLVEAKAHIEEMYQASGARALTAHGKTNPAFSMIKEALEATQVSLGLEPDALRWMRPVVHAGRERAVYQTANRLALLRFLREHGIDAVLILLLFVNDPDARPPADEAAWLDAIADVRARLGLSTSAPHMHYVFLDSEQHPLRRILAGSGS
jgi:hypothetical protein